MSEEAPSPQDYVMISLDILRRFKRPLSFDLYLKRTEHSFTKIFQQGDEIDWERVKSYEEKGLKFFCVKRDDYQSYGQYVEKLGELLPQSLSKVSPDAALEILREMVQLTLDEINFHHAVTLRAFHTAQNVVLTCMKGLKKDTKSFSKLLTLMSAAPFMYKHAISVSLFSLVVAREMGIEQEKTLSYIGLGAFLHDIGLSQLDFNPYEYQDLTPEKRAAYQRHPSIGKQLLDSIYGIEDQVLDIVISHHESPNGRGFPNGLREGEIYPPAKIIGTVDAFLDLLSHKLWRPAFTVEQALLKMRTQTGDYDTATIKALQKVLQG